jgi:hypothetical protein
MRSYSVDLLQFGRNAVCPELAAMDVMNEIRQREATITATVRDRTTGEMTIVTVKAKGKNYDAKRLMSHDPTAAGKASSGL